ncbi:hypothetical protein [Kineococcus sp. SYSU DK003]|uniref:hypothetical protein n=1 Tax=Kineococcus sp. SYSU DK003 TaxID=3383124 RepID=UPI003D7EA500
MDVVVGIVVAAVGLVGVVVLAAMAAAGGAARGGRSGDQLLVAPRGARYGDATRVVLSAARAQQEQEARVVHLHERRRRGPDASGHAA